MLSSDDGVAADKVCTVVVVLEAVALNNTAELVGACKAVVVAAPALISAVE